MPQNSINRKSNSQTISKNLHSRNCIVVPKSSPKTSDNMREVSIKLMAIMKAKKECNII